MENKDKQHLDKLGLSHPERYFEKMQDSLMDKLKHDLDDQHELGLDVPEGYFENSKENILAKVNAKPARPLFWKRKIWMAVAASIAIIISVTIWNKVQQSQNQFPSNLNAALFHKMDGEQMLLSALFVKDLQFDQLLDTYMYENVVVESALPIIESDDVTLESLFIDDQGIEDLLFESNME